MQVQDIASTLNALVGGLEVTSYQEGSEQYEVHVRAEAIWISGWNALISSARPALAGIGNVGLAGNGAG